MSVKIRLMRIGAKKRPFYRIVAVDERSKRTGKYLELIGTYNPLTEPKDIKINKEIFDKWVKQGAVLSHGFLRITKQAPQKPPRKPRKEQPAPAQPKAVVADVKAEETAAPVEETPKVEEAPVQEEAAVTEPAKEEVVEEKASEESNLPEAEKTA